MLSKDELKILLGDMESDRIERTLSIREDKIGPAVSAFSNDYPNHKLPGYILLGVSDDGTIAGAEFGDNELQGIGGVRSNGNVLPQPSMTVSTVYQFSAEEGFGKGEVVVIEVFPAFHPPVRYKGKCHIRIGPRVSVANEAEERRLTEKRTSTAKTFDAQPLPGSAVADLDSNNFQVTYLPQAIDRETLEENNRSIEQKLASLRFYDLVHRCPTNAGILLLALDPLFYLPGAYIQYIKYPGKDVSEDIEYEKRFSGALLTELAVVDRFIEGNVIKSKTVRNGSMREERVFNYPFWSMREFVMNAIMHRDYQSNAPIYIYEFADRIEIINSGGLYGEVREENFPDASDYRNPIIAEALKTMGYVNRFNLGVKNAQKKLRENGSPEAAFELNISTKFRVNIRIHPSWL